ncbi:MAG: hypothetical protein K2X81_02160 [Candidatus Obscuribacterales bacterium]|jgi:tetratricopeptide (TPR) repeat protein|nr:hypothetical protein [Candidatus Obscuribacterales bacterium]
MSDNCSSKKSGCAGGKCGPKKCGPQTKGVCFETSDKDVEFAENLIDRALSAMRNGETKLEKLLLDTALELLNKTADPNKNSVLILAYTNYSDLLFRQRKYTAARRAAKKAVALARTTFTESHTFTILALANQADAASRIGAQFDDEVCTLYQEAAKEAMGLKVLTGQNLVDLCSSVLASGAELLSTLGREKESQELLAAHAEFKSSFEFVPFRRAGFYKKGVMEGETSQA